MRTPTLQIKEVPSKLYLLVYDMLTSASAKIEHSILWPQDCIYLCIECNARVYVADTPDIGFREEPSAER
ncbi:hypothetical protein MPRF_56720 [Mycolicibacterium parafortuitum]|uniref:Uncharacterized protein n=1 Tax=Mycolicibacterium parafortuitum TaxID=39692 RepID=A0A7I7UCX2_MYCPF|nr:hypothetical protein MPRF_56720 [Mycolicibacterium parafortuitum]